MLVVGRRLFPWLLWQVQKVGSRELFTLCVVAAAVSIAYGATKLFGVSFALGAFFAGMVLRESQFSHRAARGDAAAARRLRRAVLRLGRHAVRPDGAGATSRCGCWRWSASSCFGKSIAAAVLVLLLRYPLHTALTVSASLAQIGEFSFILMALGGTLGVLPRRGAEPGGGRRADLDRAQSAAVPCHRAAAALAAARARSWRATWPRATIRWPSCR